MPINIHGKEYVTVTERIQEAGKDFLGLNTEVLYTNPVVIKATVTTRKGVFTGISMANPTKQIEKVTPYEVAETSAVGRALGFAGYGIFTGIASAEQMVKTEYEDRTYPVETDDQTSPLTSRCEKHEVIMGYHKNEKGEWWSHKLADGTWCNGLKKPVVKQTVDRSEEEYMEALTK